VAQFSSDDIRRFMQLSFKSHPWHGVAPLTLDGAYNAYIELGPTDTVKYEIDKETGHLKVDRPQKYSSLCPTLYGFIPRTYCGSRVAEICARATRRAGIEGDGDPLDVCILSEKPISRADILVSVVPIGGLRMIDKNQVDDKIIAVLKGDLEYGSWRSIHDMPSGMVDRLRHYFLTDKQMPELPSLQPGKPSAAPAQSVEITHVYDRSEALAIITASLEDYAEKYGDHEEMLAQFLANLSASAASDALSNAESALPTRAPKPTPAAKSARAGGRGAAKPERATKPAKAATSKPQAQARTQGKPSRRKADG
jgi:inorganic pyrophosphatase